MGLGPQQVAAGLKESRAQVQAWETATCFHNGDHQFCHKHRHRLNNLQATEELMTVVLTDEGCACGGKGFWLRGCVEASPGFYCWLPAPMAPKAKAATKAVAGGKAMKVVPTKAIEKSKK